MVKVLKYLRGYVRIKVWGFSPERFLNLCSNHEILLWDISREENIYYMSISLKSFYKLSSICRKTGTRVVILQRYGLPFLIPKIAHRKVFVTGCILAILFWMITSRFIWDIQLSGNYTITEDVFRVFLQQNNIHVGMLQKELDIESLEKEIRKTFPQVTWTSAKRSGTRLFIAIKENDAPILETFQEQKKESDITARFQGRILSIVVRKGVPKVKKGDLVEPGSMLVAGSIPVYNEDQTVREYQYVDADADIIMEHTRFCRITLPTSYVLKTYTGRSSRQTFLQVGEKRIGKRDKKPFLSYDTVEKTSRPLVFEKLSIPIFYTTSCNREYLNMEHLYTRKQAEEKLSDQMDLFLYRLHEKGVQIIEKNVKIDGNGKVWTLQGEFLVHESAGVNTEIQRQQVGVEETHE